MVKIDSEELSIITKFGDKAFFWEKLEEGFTEFSFGIGPIYLCKENEYKSRETLIALYNQNGRIHVIGKVEVKKSHQPTNFCVSYDIVFNSEKEFYEFLGNPRIRLIRDDKFKNLSDIVNSL